MMGVGQGTVNLVFNVWLSFSCEHKVVLLPDRDLLDYVCAKMMI